MRTVSLLQPWTTTVPTMFMTRNAPSIPRGIRRSIFFWAASGEGKARISIAPRIAAKLLGATRHLRRPAQQVDLLLVVRRQHVDEQLVGWIARQRAACLLNRFVNGAQTRFQLSDSFGGERRLLLIEQVLQRARLPEIVVLLDCELVESSRRSTFAGGWRD